MSHQFRFSRARRTGVMLITGAALAAVPAAAQASAVNLGTAAPFVVLGGQSATNTGPSVLNGDLGVSPGTSLTGFGLPAVVNGATHNNDAVAAQAQSDLTTAYNVAAGQPVTTDLTGQDLGGLNLPAGAYHYSSSAQLTGQLTLDAAGDPNAQFVFEIGTTLTTASASSVRLINGASPCNVYWQVGSSATLDTTTDFAGTVMALASVTLNNGATVRGRMLARTGSVTLDNNVLDASMCRTPIAGPPTPTATPAPTTAPPGTTPPGTTPGAPGAPGSTPGAPGSGGQTPPASGTSVPTRKGTARLYPGGPLAPCTTGFRARVRGHMIKRVIFTIAGKRIATRRGSGFRVYVRPEVGKRGTLKAHVTFKDATRHMTRTFHYRACAAQVLRPALGPSQFTG
jgi:hypothetical protein